MRQLRKEVPSITKHVRERWDKRMPQDAKAPEYAWERGIKLGKIKLYFSFDRSYTHKEVRIYHGKTESGKEYTAILLNKNGVMVTTFPFSHVSNGAVRDYLWMLSGSGIHQE